MTLKEFAKAWKECKNADERNKLNDELHEKYGVDMFEFDEIYYEFKENQWQDELKEWEYEYLYDYFLEQLAIYGLFSLNFYPKRQSIVVFI